MKLNMSPKHQTSLIPDAKRGSHLCHVRRMRSATCMLTYARTNYPFLFSRWLSRLSNYAAEQSVSHQRGTVGGVHRAWYFLPQHMKPRCDDDLLYAFTETSLQTLHSITFTGSS